MKRIFFALGILGSVVVAGYSTDAEAACAATSASMKDNASTTFAMGLAADPNGNCNSYFTPLQGSALLSATNGWYTNLLQGNAVLSATNPIFISPATSSVWQVQSNSANLATQTTLAALLTALGTPMQATGGSVTANAGTNLNTSALSLAATQGATTDTPATAPASATAASEIALLKALLNVGQYPSGAVAITASATGTTAATTATLAGTTGKTTYICSYSIRANAAAATTVQNTVTGVITGTMTHQMWVAPSASGIGVDEQVFNPCVPASATNTAIAVVSGAPGTSGLVSATATGYQL